MPRKPDLSDRYARAGQRRERRRVVSRPDDLTVRPAGDRQADEPATQAAPAAGPRPVTRGRPAPAISYHYIRADLVRIAVVTGIILLLMAALFVILR